MMYLILSVVFTILVFVILKEFNRFKVDNFQAIVINYFVAFTTGVFFDDVLYSTNQILTKPWVWGAIAIAVLFIIGFNLMAVTAQKLGLFMMTVSSKMSMMIPIIVGVMLYQDKIGYLKLFGVILALFGVWFVAKKKETSRYDKSYWYLPFLIFIVGGVADSLINHMQTQMVGHQEQAQFTSVLFLFCGLIGMVVLVASLLRGKKKICFKSWLGGVVLGVPNYFTIYYLVKALSYSHFGTAFIFSFNNVFIVIGSLLLGVWVYKEKLSLHNYIGLVLSLSAIAVLYFAV